MNSGNEPPPLSTASFSRAARIDEVCDRFEAVWQAGERPSIAEFLGETTSTARTALLRELLLVDLACRRCRGERPEPNDYLEQLPGETELVIAAFDEFESTVSRLDSTSLDASDLYGNAPALGPVIDDTSSMGVRYKVLRRHAQGGLGEVFVAHEEELKREVALKQIRPEYAGDLVSQSRFLREAEITGGLGHPGIVPIYGLGRHPDGRPFYVMPFIRGHSFDEAIKRFHAKGQAGGAGPRAVEFRKLLSHFLNVCLAIDYAHSQKVIHRDIKPSNIMIGPFGETLVVDWGLAKPFASPRQNAGNELGPPAEQPAQEAVETLPGSPLGTPHYMSPEQAAGQLELLGPSTDIYSLGATLYCLLTGRAPFTERELPKLLRRVQQGDFEPPRRVDRSIPRPLEAVCLKALARQPANRYVTARALADDIERWLADEPVSAYREPWPTRLARWGRGHKPAISGIAALLVTAVVALGVSTVLIGQEKRREEFQRKRAEVNFVRARNAVDQMLSEAGEIELAEVPQMETARQKLLEKALAFYRAFAAERGNDPSVRVDSGRAQSRLGALYDLLGNVGESEAAYRQAIHVFESEARAARQENMLAPDLARADQGLGVLLKKSNRFQEAELMLRTALRLREAMAARQADRLDIQQDVAETQYHLATLLARLPRRQPDDEHIYQEAVKTQASLALAAGASPDSRRRLVRYLNNLGLLLFEAGRRAEAEQYDRQAIKILEEDLSHEPTSPRSRWHLARSEANLGVLLQKSGQAVEAENCLRRALARQKQLVAEFPRILDYRQELASILNNLGLLLSSSHKVALAEAAFRESVALREPLANLIPEVPDYLQKLAVTRLNLALLLEPVDPLAARQTYRDALGVQEHLTGMFPSVPEYRLALGRTYYSLAGLHFKQEELEEALRLVEQAISQHRLVLGSNSRNQTNHDYLRDDYGVLTVILVRLKRHADAAQAAALLPGLAPDQALEYLRASAFLVECAELAWRDETLAQADRDSCQRDYQDRAVGLLRQGFESGVLKSSALLDLPEYRPLQQHAGFKRLWSEMSRAAGAGPG